MRDDRAGRDADLAVAALYDAHYRSLARIAALLAGFAVAEEIAQDAFASVHRELRRGQDGNEALGYLRQAVVTRARSRRAAPADPPGIPEPALLVALSGLPARQREALVLRYYADWPDPQIAAAMGIRRHALNGHVRRGMSALRACLTPGTGSGT